MDGLFRFASLLAAIDWAALFVYFALWIGYAWFASHRSRTRPSLLEVGQQVRLRWMREATYRDPRVMDAVVVQGLTSSPSFFASTTILIIGGLLAVLGSNEQATAMVRELPFAARTSVQEFDLKVLVLCAVFVYAFFRFTWSLRQYAFGAMLVAAIPSPERVQQQGESLREQRAQSAAGMLSHAAESFNDGLRAYYFAFACVAWFFSPWVLMLATAAVVVVLYVREFHSDALTLMRA